MEVTDMEETILDDIFSEETDTDETVFSETENAFSLYDDDWPLHDDTEPTSEEDNGYDTLYSPPYSREELEQLTEVTVPEGMTGICSGAFRNCKKLVSVHLPESMQSIYKCAFKGCSALASINLPESVHWIGGQAFKDCVSLEEIYLPEKGCWVEKDAFSGSGLRSVYIPDETRLFGNTYEDESGFGLYAFRNCRNLVSVRLPRDLDWVSGFEGCTSLRSIRIPQGVTVICESAFRNCTSLVSVEFPEGLELIDRHAFEDCSSLVSADLPKELKRICWDAFKNCTSLVSVSLPDTTEADGGVFSGCTALADENGFVIVRNELHAYTGNASEIVIPEGITAVQPGVFAANETITRAVIPQGIEWLATAFKDCVNLEEVVLPDTLKIIGRVTFSGCDNLKTVVLPAGLETLGSRCFADCKNLEPVFRGKPSDIAEDAFKGCSKVLRLSADVTGQTAKLLKGSRVAAVILDEGAAFISKRAFSGCTGLRSVLLPDSMKEIGEFAFADCKNLSFINLPKDVRIADWAFYGCENLHLDR